MREDAPTTADTDLEGQLWENQQELDQMIAYEHNLQAEVMPECTFSKR